MPDFAWISERCIANAQARVAGSYPYYSNILLLCLVALCRRCSQMLVKEIPIATQVDVDIGEVARGRGLEVRLFSNQLWQLSFNLLRRLASKGLTVELEAYDSHELTRLVYGREQPTSCIIL